jgi:hypothetical protein
MSLTKASFSMVTGAPANVMDFGAVGDGVTNDRAAIQAAFDANDAVYFPAGTYYVGQLASGASAIDLRGKGNNITILTQGFVELVCETTNTSENSFFILRPTDGSTSSHFYCDPIRFRDTGFVATFPYQGAIGFLIQNGNSNWGNLRFIGVYGKNVYGAIQVSNYGNSDISGNRIRGLFVDEVYVDNGIYGVNLAAQGDACYFKKIVTYQVYRALFAYNVQGVEATIYARNNRSTSGVVNLGWFTQASTPPDLSGIKVRYVARECVEAVNHVLVNVIGPNLGTIKGLELDVDIKDDVTGNPSVLFTNYATSGGASDPTPTANTVTDIIIQGRVADASNVIGSDANYTSTQALTLLSTNIPVSANVYNNFAFSTVRSYTPTWTGSVSNPAIGNGTLSGVYSVHNGLCQVTVQMTAGSTTTFGSGTWSFALPVTSRSTLATFGSSRASDGGTFYVGAAYASGTVAQVSFDATGDLSETVPFTWATGDTLLLTVSYPI